MEDTCEYTVEVPSTVCSTSSKVDVIVASANRLGLGPPSEPTTIGMTLTHPLLIYAIVGLPKPRVQVAY